MNRLINKDELNKLTASVNNRVGDIFGKHLKLIILKGDYADETVTENSVIEYWVIVDLNKTEMYSYMKTLKELSGLYEVQYNVPVKISAEDYYAFSHFPDKGFYKELHEKGIIIS